MRRPHCTQFNQLTINMINTGKFLSIITNWCPGLIWENIKIYVNSISFLTIKYRADSRLALGQWETSLQSNAVSHWLETNLEWALKYNRLLSYILRRRQHSFPFQIINIMAANALAMCVARASAAKVLTMLPTLYFPQNQKPELPHLKKQKYAY